jgi:hypothetical protein
LSVGTSLNSLGRRQASASCSSDMVTIEQRSGFEEV